MPWYVSNNNNNNNNNNIDNDNDNNDDDDAEKCGRLPQHFLTPIRRRCSHTLFSTMFKTRGFVLVVEKKIIMKYLYSANEVRRFIGADSHDC